MLVLLMLAALAPGYDAFLVTGNITLDNGIDWGTWGPLEFCPEGSYVHAFDTLYEVGSSTDETAVNALMLFCSTQAHHDTGYVTSTIGEYGDWQGMRICPDGWVTGMRGNVLEPQGIVHDDVAVTNIELACGASNSTIVGVEGVGDAKYTPGKWGSWDHCEYGSAVCGIQVQWDEPQVGDDAATSNVMLMCCRLY